MTITALRSLSSLCLGNADHVHALGSPQATALGKVVAHAQQPPNTGSTVTLCPFLGGTPTAEDPTGVGFSYARAPKLPLGKVT